MIVHSDALIFLKSLPDESVDLFLSDPPYDSINKYREMNPKCPKLSNWFQTVDILYLNNCFEEVSRILKPGKHAYIMCNWETQREISNKIADLELKNILIWDKCKIGMGYHWRKTYEMIMYFVKKGKKTKLRDLSIGDVLRIPRLNGTQYYPTQKPLELFEIIITNSTNVGDLVVDPFLGSGTTAAAAEHTKRKFNGCDISEEAVLIAESWVKSLTCEQLILI